MSYSFRGTASGGHITTWDEQPQVGYAEGQSKDDLDLAHELVARIAATLQGECVISGGGHANPHRLPAADWASDQMSISVARLSAPLTPRQPDPVAAPEPAVVTQPVATEPEPQPVDDGGAAVPAPEVVADPATPNPATADPAWPATPNA